MLAADFSSARRSDWSLPVAMFGAYAAACLFALPQTAFSMAQTWMTSSTYHHGVAVAPLALLMILSRPRIDPATGPLGLVAVAAGAFLWLAGRAAGVALVEQAAFVTLLIAGAWVMFGAGAVKLWALPLLFLYFMVPFGEVLIPALQAFTAKAVAAMLTLVGTGATIDGTFIRTGAGVFEIAEACAGLNFLLAAMMIAWVYASQTLPDVKTRAAFIAVAAAVALSANFLRAFLLVLVATLSDMRFAVGPDHFVVGLVFYALVFAVLFWVGGKMHRPHGVGPEHAPVRARRPWHFSIAAFAFAPIAIASFYAAFVINGGAAIASPPQLSPLSAPGWRLLGGPQNWAPTINADAIEAVTYDRNGERVYVTLGWFERDRPGKEIVNRMNASADGKDWRKIASFKDVVYLFGDAKEIPLEIVAGPERRRLLVATAYWRGDAVYTNKIAFKWAQMKDKLKGVNPEGGVIIIASNYAGEPAEALARIRAFTSDVERFDDWRARMRAAP